MSTTIDPITLEEAEEPIKFSWTGPTTWGVKCNDEEHEYNWTHFYIDRILNTNSGTISQNVVHNAYNQQYSGNGSPYYWTAPKHYRYIKAFDSKTSAFTYSSNWSTYTATSDSRTLTADGKLLGSTMAQTNVRGSTATATIDTLGGDSFVVRYVARPFGGKMRVSIDGVEAGVIDQEAHRDECGWQVEWKKANVPT